MKYLTIITNFGDNEVFSRTTISGLDRLKDAIKFEGADCIRLADSGDPFYDYENHQKYFYRLLRVCREMNIPLEIHTRHPEVDFPFKKCLRVVYKLRNLESLQQVTRRGAHIVEVEFTIDRSCTLDLIDKVYDICTASPDIDKLSFRSNTEPWGEIGKCCRDYLREGAGTKWGHIERFEEKPPYFVNGTIYYHHSDIFD